MLMMGRCLCEAVSFTAHDVRTDVEICHCGQCRRWSGGPILAIAVGSVAFSGEEHIRRYESSAWAQRGFCLQCGSNLFYQHKKTGGYSIWLGAFDDQAPFRMNEEIFIDEKPGCYSFAGDHRRLTGAEVMGTASPS